MKYLKKTLFTLLVLVTLASCGSVKTVKVKVNNRLDFDRTDELVELPVAHLEKKLKKSAGELIVMDKSGAVIPSQKTSEGFLIFPSGLQANSKKVFLVKKGEEVQYDPQVFGRVYPERFEDFAWENDRIGFRFYGNPLKKHDGPSNGLDLWYKRTNKLVLNEWYRKSVHEGISYHVDHGEGCDPYGVGHTLGAGAMAPFAEGELVLNDNYLTAEILDEGPLRFKAKLTYPTLRIGDKEYQESRTVTLDMGSQMTKIEQDYHTNDQLTLAAGVVKRHSGDSIDWNHGESYFLYKEPASKENGQIFIGVIVPDGLDSVEVKRYQYDHPIHKRVQHHAHTLGFTKNKPGEVTTYYTGFGWNKAGFDSIEAFKVYVEQYYKALKEPFDIKF